MPFFLTGNESCLHYFKASGIKLHYNDAALLHLAYFTLSHCAVHLTTDAP